MTRVQRVERQKRTSRLALLALVASCGGCASVVPLVSGAEVVVVARQAPPVGSRNLGIAAGVHGSGCGFVGLRGNEEGAMAALKNKAAEIGANYVQIERMVTPYSDGKCLHNEFRIEGTSYVQATLQDGGSTSIGR